MKFSTDMDSLFYDFHVNADGKKEWRRQSGDRYVVTGTNAKGQRVWFRTVILQHALSINLYRGSVWLERAGRRKLIRSVTN